LNRIRLRLQAPIPSAKSKTLAQFMGKGEEQCPRAFFCKRMNNVLDIAGPAAETTVVHKEVNHEHVG
jgi:hypothetical protein